MNGIIVHFRAETVEGGKELLIDLEGSNPPTLGEVGFENLIQQVTQSIDGGLAQGEFHTHGINYRIEVCECCISNAKKEALTKQINKIDKS